MLRRTLEGLLSPVPLTPLPKNCWAVLLVWLGSTNFTLGIPLSLPSVLLSCLGREEQAPSYLPLYVYRKRPDVRALFYFRRKDALELDGTDLGGAQLRG